MIETLGGAVEISLEDGGCCGTTYVFQQRDPAKEPEKGESWFGCDGARLIVRESVIDVVRGATIDFSARIRPPRFRVLSNPNTPDHCPCRRSFGATWPGPNQPACRSYLPMPWDTEFDPPARWKRQTGREG